MSDFFEAHYAGQEGTGRFAGSKHMNLLPQNNTRDDRERLALLANAVRARIWETDAGLGVIFLVGEYFDQDVDLPSYQTVGRSLIEIFSDAEHGPGFEALIRNLKARRPIHDYRYARFTPKGEEVFLTAFAHPRFDETGSFLGYQGVSINVTSETKALREAEFQRSRLREALGAIPDGFAVYDRDDRLAAFNQAYKAMYGNSVKLGATSREIVEASSHNQVAANNDGTGANELRARRARSERGPLPPIEERLADGRWIRNLSVPLDTGGRAELRTDVTEIRQREYSERESRLRFARLFEAAANGIFVTDLAGNFVDANPAFCKLMGLDQNLLLGTDFFSHLHPDELEEERTLRSQLIGGESSDFVVERRWVLNSAKSIWTRNSAALVPDGDGKPAQIIAICEDITERKNAELKLREQEDLLEIAGQSANLGGWKIDLPSRQVTWSTQACEIYGVPPGSTELAEEWSQRIHADDRERVLCAVEECIAHGISYDVEFRISRPAGENKWIRSVGRPIYDDAGRVVRLQGSIQDISKQRKLRDEARDLATRLESVLESISDVFFSLDGEWRYTYLNSRAVDLTGIPAIEMIGKRIWDVYPGAEGTLVRQNYEKVMYERVPAAFEAVGLAGKWLEIRAYPSDNGMTVFMRDISERKSLERQLAHTSRLTSMGEMAASLAHEINQPLSAISMAAENALMEMELGAFDRDYVENRLEVVVEQIEHTRDIINHVRSFARRDDIPGDVFDPVEACQAALKLFAREFEKEDLVVEANFPHDCPRVFGHKVRLEQAIVNVVSNARDAILARVKSEPGAPKTIRVCVDADIDAVDISVTDSGGGIPDEIIDKVFEPFETTKESGRGTGLGLSIVHSIVTAMGGQIEATNEGSGARMSICLPRYKG